MGAWGIVRKIKEIWGWIKFVADMLGLLGLLAFVTGVGASVGGAIWAVMVGVSLPIALMVGFCVFVMGVYFAMAPMMYRTLALAQAQISASRSSQESREPATTENAGT